RERRYLRWSRRWPRHHTLGLRPGNPGADIPIDWRAPIAGLLLWRWFAELPAHQDKEHGLLDQRSGRYPPRRTERIERKLSQAERSGRVLPDGRIVPSTPDEAWFERKKEGYHKPRQVSAVPRGVRCASPPP